MTTKPESDERILRSALRWGSTYSAGLPLEDTADAITQEARRQRLEIVFTRQRADYWLIEAIQTAPWYLILAKALPQRVRWVLQRKENRTVITSDNRFFLWHLLFILCSCAVTWSLFDSAFHVIISTGLAGGSNPIWGFFLLIIAVLLLFANFYWVSRGVASRMREWMHSLEQNVEARGAFIEHGKSSASKRSTCRLIGYLGFAVGIVASAASKASGNTQQGISTILGAGVGGLLALVIVLMVVLLYSSLGHRGFSWRSLPLIPGICTAMAFVFFVSPIAIWLIVSTQAQDVSDISQKLQLYVRSDPRSTAKRDNPQTNLTQLKHEASVEAIAWFRTYSRAFIATSFFIIGIGIYIFIVTVYSALSFWPWIARLQRNAHLDYVRTATTGQGFLSTFRWIFIAFLLCSSLFFLAGLVILVASIVLGLFGITMSDLPKLAVIHITDASAFMTAVALGMEETTVRPFVLGAWTFYTALCVTPHVVSFTHWLRSRRFLQETLRRNAASSIDGQAKTQETLHRLAVTAGLKCPKLSVSPDFVVYSRSISFGLTQKKLFVDISSRCLREFDEEEIEALMAHELAHHALKHCRQDNVCLAFGRLTLVGDSFTRALEDSFGYEMKADRMAIEEFRANPEALMRCLQKMRTLSIKEKQSFVPILNAFSALGLAAHQTEGNLSNGPKSLKLKDRCRLAWKLYCDQFTGKVVTSYWYPAIDERLNALAKLAPRLSNGAIGTSP